jgi:hypothetical protein
MNGLALGTEVIGQDKIWGHVAVLLARKVVDRHRIETKNDDVGKDQISSSA